MRRFLALLLAMTLVLCGCGKNSSTGSANMDLAGVNQLGDQVEYSLVYGYVSEKVLPPILPTVYSYFEADVGNTFVVIVMDVKNLSSRAVTADKLLDATLKAGVVKYDANCAVEEDGGTNLGYSNITDIQPLETARIYYMFETPDTVNQRELTLTVARDDHKHQATIDMTMFESRVQTWYSGQTKGDETTLQATLEGIYFSDTLYPPKADGYYHFYEAEEGKTYLIAKMTVKNLKSTDLEYADICGVTCIYDGRYTYQAVTVHEADGGEDLSSYSDTIKPLDTGVIYYMMEVPEEVENGDVTVRFYLQGQYYQQPV